jgi:pimeloyl-ACP methyl ester carboxylesterase
VASRPGRTGGRVTGPARLLIDRCPHLVGQLPDARGRVIPQTAHLPYLERPDLVADLIRQAVTAA